MASVFSAGNWLSSGSVRFVTRRTALSIALGAACGAAVLALAGGVAIGRHWPAHEAPGAHGDNPIEHDYAIDQLGKLSASVAQIEPRIARLTAQVDTLRDFEARLNTPRPAPRASALPSAPSAPGKPGPASEADLSATDGAGGPALPPRRCSELAPPTRSHADAEHTRQLVDCIAATLSALEQQTADHAIAYAAFPGRLPVDGARFGSPFGNRSDPFTHRLSFHPGIDLVARTGTPILAAAGGRVVFAGEKAGYGNAVDFTDTRSEVSDDRQKPFLGVRCGSLSFDRLGTGGASGGFLRWMKEAGISVEVPKNFRSGQAGEAGASVSSVYNLGTAVRRLSTPLWCGQPSYAHGEFRFL